MSQYINDLYMIPLIDAGDFPPEVEDYCIEHEIPTHYDSAVVQVDLRDGNPLAKWLLTRGYVVTLVDERRGWAHIAVQGT